MLEVELLMGEGEFNEGVNVEVEHVLFNSRDAA